MKIAFDNWFRHCLTGFALTVLLWAGAPLPGVSAEEEAPEGVPENLDAVLMLDASGSMLVTDPQRLRNQGAKLFSRFLKDGDRLAIVEFSENTKVIRPLSAYNPQQLESVAKNIDQVSETGRFTDLLKAVAKAKEMLEADFRENASQVVVLLSDGKFEPDPKVGTAEVLTQQLLEHVVPESRSLGIKFYTLAFSDQADRELLKEIAVGSGGVNWFAASPDDIHNSYADLFLVVKKPQLVPLTKAGFQVDEDVKEATFYINKEGNATLSLVAPGGSILSSGKESDKVRWFSGQNFDVITVIGPEPGYWQVSGISSPDGYAQVLTNLKLVTDWPTAISSGEKVLLQVRLYDSQKPVILPEMTDVVQYNFFITPTDRISEPVARGSLYDDGTHGDKVAKDGVFTSEVEIPDPGEYKLRVIARAPTFERNQQMPFRVKPPLIALSVYHKAAESEALRTLMEMEEQAKTGGKPKPSKVEDPNIYRERDVIRAQLSEEARAFKSVSVNLLAADEQHRELIIPMKSGKETPLTYEIDEFALPAEGRYELKAVLLASGQKGKSVQEMTAPLSFEKKTRGEGGNGQMVVVERSKAPSGPASPALPLLLVTLMNTVAGVLTFSLIRKAQAGAAVTMPSFTPLSTFLPEIESLREKSRKSDIDLDDPRFASAVPIDRSEEEPAEVSPEPDVTPEPQAEEESAPGGSETVTDPAVSELGDELSDLLEGLEDGGAEPDGSDGGGEE